MCHQTDQDKLKPALSVSNKRDAADAVVKLSNLFRPELQARIERGKRAKPEDEEQERLKREQDERERDLRKMLRPHWEDPEREDPKSATAPDEETRRGFDSALNQLAALELGVSTGYLKLKSAIEHIKALGVETQKPDDPSQAAAGDTTGHAPPMLKLLTSRTVARFIDDYDYFQVRFLANRIKLSELKLHPFPDFPPPDDSDKEKPELLSDRLKLPGLAAPPVLPDWPKRDEIVSAFFTQTCTLQEQADVQQLYRFLNNDEFPGVEERGRHDRFRLWLADGGVQTGRASPAESAAPTEIEEIKQFRTLQSAIQTWVEKRYATYHDKPEPVQARFAIFDIYWLLKLFNTEISTSGDVTYCGTSWITLVGESLHLSPDENKEYLNAKRTLRRALGLACDWTRGEAIEVDPATLATPAGMEQAAAPGATATGIPAQPATVARPAAMEQKPADSAPPPPAPVTWVDAFKEELREIFTHRKERHLVCAPKEGSQEEPLKVRHSLIGLAFSGGGIRSATFNLGVLEALKENDLLRFVDYLSTVSGGGYIGSWLVANAKRRGYWVRREADWRESVKYLRDYSNYLAPHFGFMSPDTWTMWTTFIRNTLLVQIQVFLAIAFCLLVPYLVGFPFDGLLRASGQWWSFVPEALSAFSLVVVTWLVCSSLLSPRALAHTGSKSNKGQSRWRIPVAVVVFVIASLSLTVVIWRAADQLWRDCQHSYGVILWRVASTPVMLLVLLACYIALLLLAFASAKSDRQDPNAGASAPAATLSGSAKKHWDDMTAYARWTAALAPAGALAALLLEVSALILLLQFWTSSSQAGQAGWMLGKALERAFVFGPVLVMTAISLSVYMLIGLLGRASDRQPREWWSRFGALLWMTGAGWLALNVAAVYSPHCIDLLRGLRWIPILGWLATSAAGVFAGSSGSTSGRSDSTEDASKANMALEVLAVAGPVVAIAGIVVAISAALYAVLLEVGPVLGVNYWVRLGNIDLGTVLIAVAVVLVAGLLLTWRVDINIFSLSEFYRTRLVRCYLGATREKRSPHPFTGFDEKDDLPLAKLQTKTPTVLLTAEEETDERAPFAGPFPIINCTLNLGGSSDLAVKTRQSACFTMTPLHCGYNHKLSGGDGLSVGGYAPTQSYCGKEAPTLGVAVAVSGAAASPNMGYHTSPLTSFLMTVFNARLGCWFANPASKTQVDRFSPRFAFPSLVSELLGTADDRSDFVAISDGGHFENLGIYELVRRRCRLIIASDAECDPEIQFESLGRVIRLCEVDFGAKITIDVASIRRDPRTGRSKSHCAVGRIEYGNGSLGTLVYIKASLLEGEDTAVLQYHSEHPTFPHETTANQFFTEDQFESYRKLGHDCAKRTFRDVTLRNVDDNELELEEFADQLGNIWTPVKNAPASFISSTTALMRLWEKLGKDEDLSDLANEIINHTPPPPGWPENGRVSGREFYFCNEIIQLLENVHLDLHLDDTWDDPDNAGWKDLFLRCARSARFQIVWRKSRGTYGRRFRYFCERRLNLN